MMYEKYTLYSVVMKRWMANKIINDSFIKPNRMHWIKDIKPCLTTQGLAGRINRVVITEESEKAIVCEVDHTFYFWIAKSAIIKITPES